MPNNEELEKVKPLVFNLYSLGINNSSIAQITGISRYYVKKMTQGMRIDGSNVKKILSTVCMAEILV